MLDIEYVFFIPVADAIEGPFPLSNIADQLSTATIGGL